MTHDLQIWLRDKMMEDAKRSKYRFRDIIKNRQGMDKGSLTDAILGVLSDGPMTAKEVAEAMADRTARSSVNVMLSRLRAEGRIVKVGGMGGQFALPAKARAKA